MKFDSKCLHSFKFKTFKINCLRSIKIQMISYIKLAILKSIQQYINNLNSSDVH